MKQGWEIKKLGEVLQKTETIDPTKKPNLTFKYVDVSSVSNTTYSIDNYVEIYGKDAPSRARKLIKGGDVLFATVRPTLKRIAIVPNALNSAVCSTGYFVLRPKAECYNRFLYFYLQSDRFIDYIKTKEKGASYPAVTDGDVKSSELAIPTIEVQERIVGILDNAFAKIEALRANAQQNLQNAKDLFQASLKQELTPKQGWSVKRIGDIGKISMCKRVLKEQTTSNGEIPFYKIGTFGKVADAFISNEIYTEFKNKFSFPRKGNILISASGTIGRRVKYDGKPAYFQDSNIVWVDNDEKQVLDNYLFYCYGACEWKATNGATIARLYNDNLRQINISYPIVHEEQQSIVKKLNALSNRCQAMEENCRQTIAHCNALKQALLTKAFNGEL